MHKPEPVIPYAKKIEMASKAAGTLEGSAWNLTFRRHLAAEGLTIVPENPELMSAHGWIRAPRAIFAAYAWPEASMIMPVNFRG